MKTVAIIGGGITGLTAAFGLKQQGVPVKLFEAGNRVGGVIQSMRREGHLAEFGPNSILETSPVISGLVQDLGLEQRKVYSDPGAEKRFIVRGGEAIEMPTTPGAFLRTKLFSAAAKFRLFAEPLLPRGPAGDKESIGQFVQRRLGQEFLDYAINPLVAGIYAGDTAKLSVKCAFPKLHALEQKYGSLLLGQVLGARARKKSGEVSKQDAKKFSFDAGLQVLIDRLQEKLSGEIVLNSPVRSLEQTADGWRVHLDDQADSEAETFDSVVLALPAYKLAWLKMKTDVPVDFSSLADIHYPSVASVVLGFKRSDVAHPLDGFGMLIPEKEKLNILGALFSSSLFPNRAPQGEVTITCYLGGCRNPMLASNSLEELARLTEIDLGKILGITGRPTFQQVTVFKRAIPQYNVGFGRYLEVMQAAERNAPGLFIAGHARDGISLSDSITSGHNIAGRIQTFLAADKKQPATLELQNAA